MNATDCVVIDTNVWAVAEELHDGASDACRAACLQILEQVSSGIDIVVDDTDFILAEYLNVLNASKAAGLASKLAQRLWRTRHGSSGCRRVTITPDDARLGSFVEVPPLLKDFDLDDHKFLAVAVAEASRPPIFEAVDREWWVRRADFPTAGIDVQFVCPVDVMT